MNSVSWLIYAAEVSENIKWTFGLLGTACGITGIVMVVAGAAKRDFAQFDSDPRPARDYGISLQAKSPPWFIAMAALWALSAPLPSKQTLMMIGVSEVGETIIASKQAQDIGGEAGALASDSLKLLRKYVNEQLGEDEAE